MERANAAFLVVVVLASATSATVAADFGTEVNTLGNVAPLLQERTTVASEPVELSDDELRIRLTVRNPTSFEFRVTGATFTLRNETAGRLFQGPAERTDGPATVPADGSVTLTWTTSLGPERDRVAGALSADEAVLSGQFGVVVNDEEVTLRMEPRSATEASG